MKDLWNDRDAEKAVERWGPEHGEDLALRAYSSRLLGAEPGLVLHGGGNTSVKGGGTDVFGDQRPAVWVKASGRDLAAAGPEDHVAVDLERLRRLLEDDREVPDDAGLARLYRAALLDPDAPGPSIEAAVHAAVPGKYVDHTHADAVLALTNRPDADEAVRQALGEDVAVLPYAVPGLELARAVARALEAEGERVAEAGAMVWLRHGLMTWGPSARDAYRRTIELVTRAEEALTSVRRGRPAPAPDLPAADERERRMAAALPVLRGLLARPSGDPDRPVRRVILRSDLSDEALALLARPDLPDLASSAPLTADHLIRTGPFYAAAGGGGVDLPWEEPEAAELAGGEGATEGAAPGRPAERLAPVLERLVEEHRERYRAYVERHRERLPEGTRPFDPSPRVVLLPEAGIVAVGGDAREAGIALDVARHTLRTKAAMANAGVEYEGLPEEHLFDMEYRPLQRAKLRPTAISPYGTETGEGSGQPPADTGLLGRRGGSGRPPAESTTPVPETEGGRGRSLPPARGGEGRGEGGRSQQGGRSALEAAVTLLTGAAGAIGAGICRVLLEAGAHLVVTDLAGAALDSLAAELAAEHPGRVLAVPVDVTDRASVAAGFDAAAREWGGVDLVVPNAGLAHVATLEELELPDFERLERVNVHGTLLVLSEAARRFRVQGTGGDVVVISTKNVFMPGASFGAYSATKAASHQLARVASQELAGIGVRVNMVSPDAVFGEGERRSGLWAEVGPARMRARGLDEDGLEEYYRQRNLLGTRVTARHVGEAVLFFASRRTPTTGATLPVDGGLPDSTPR